MRAFTDMPCGAHTSTKSMSFNVSPTFFRAPVIAGTGPGAKRCFRVEIFFQISARVWTD